MTKYLISTLNMLNNVFVNLFLNAQLYYLYPNITNNIMNKTSITK